MRHRHHRCVGCETQGRPGGRERPICCMSDGVRKPLRTNGLARAARERQRFRRRKRDRGGNHEGASGGHHRKHGWHCLGGPCPEKFSGEPPCFFQTQALHGVPRRNRATTGMIAAVDRRRRLHRRSRQCRAKCWRAPQECAHECWESCNGQCSTVGAVADALVRSKRCEWPTWISALTPGRSSRAAVRGCAIAGGRRRSSPVCS